MSPAPPVTATPAAVLAEVVAHFGERVVDVQHVGVEPEPRIPTAGWYTLGACAMVLGLGLVVTSLPDAPRIEPTVTIDEPAPAPGPGAAGLGALLVLLGVVPLVVAARSQHVPRDRYVIGEGPDVHLPVALPPGATQAGVPLVRALERQIVLGLVPGMTGELHDGAQTTAVADLVAQGRSSFALPAAARAELRLGELRFTVQAVERAAFVPERGRLDRLYLLSNAGALAALGALLWIGEPPTGPLEVEEQSARRLLAVQYLTDVPPPPPPPPAVAPPVPRDRPRAASSKPAPPPSAPPPPTVDELAVEDSGSEKIVPKGTRRGIRNDHSYARVAGILNDEEFNDSVQRATADTQERLLGYDNEADRAMWVAVRDAPVINRPFGGLELAETERGGGLHDDRPRPAKGPGKNVEIDLNAKRTPPSAEARAIARRVVTIELEHPNIVGDMNRQTVREDLRAQTEGLRRCFRETVDKTERVGHVMLMLKVAGSGKVTSAQLKFSSTQLGPIGPCIIRVASAWKFKDGTLDRKPASIVVEVVYSARDM